ncbi:unnamed protein product [Rhizophagus irregularis]|uniref:Uncharacterized protein n=1 Tax=Rhizophagus irregularis TaxID=588596 RepID=A0A915ZF37_9GLOM|nr:hypothetical protein RIR_jg15334.t1 [Rhizophagus irregularis DAOM 181602=DAOM 197198]CAB5372126.1 unnamed protein product [Rhizophagus irregularis]
MQGSELYLTLHVAGITIYLNLEKVFKNLANIHMNTPQEYPSTCGASSLSNIKSKFSTEEYPPTANLI